MALNTLALGLATLSMLIQGAQAFAQQQAENTRSQVEIDNARRAAAFDLSALQDQMYQAKQATDLQIFERQRQALRDQSRILVSAGEAGVGGNSLLRSLVQQEWDLAHDTGIHRTNLQNRLFHTTQQARAVTANLDSRVNTAEARMRNPWLYTALQIPSIAIGGYQTYQGIKELGIGG